MSDLTPTDEAEVELGGSAPGDSSEQKAAERVAMDLLSERLGVPLSPLRIPLHGGGRLELDGASRDPPILVEAWAHQGPPKAAQKAKIMTDAMRLQLAARTLGTEPKLVLLLTDHEAAAHFTGRSWMAEALRELSIEVQVVDLPEDVRQAVLRAQTRQYR
jgi:hypothetical protein